MSFLIGIELFFSTVAEVFDARQVRHEENAQRHMRNIRTIINNSSFEADKKAFQSDYTKLKQSFDVSAKEVLYEKRAG